MAAEEPNQGKRHSHAGAIAVVGVAGAGAAGLGLWLATRGGSTSTPSSCPPGQYLPAGASGCEHCPSGMVRSSGMPIDVCVACQSGYQALSDQSGCAPTTPVITSTPPPTSTPTPTWAAWWASASLPDRTAAVVWWRCLRRSPGNPPAARTTGSALAAQGVDPWDAYYNGNCGDISDWQPVDANIACAAFRFITDAGCEFWHDLIGGNPLYPTTSGPGGICEPTWSAVGAPGCTTLVNDAGSRLLDRPWSTSGCNPPGEVFGGVPLYQATAFAMHIVCESEFATGCKDQAQASTPPWIASVAPTAVTTSATNVTSTSATLNGNVSDGGLAALGGGPTNCDFNISTSPGGSSTPVGANPGRFTGSASPTATVSVEPGKTYYFQVAAWAVDGGAAAYGEWVSFTTPAAGAALASAAASASASLDYPSYYIQQPVMSAPGIL